MHPIYTTSFHPGQALVQATEDFINILEIAEYVDEPTVQQACDSSRRSPQSRLTFAELRERICADFSLGCVSAEATMQRLHDHNLFGSPDQFMRIFAAGVEALAESPVD